MKSVEFTDKILGIYFSALIATVCTFLLPPPLCVWCVCGVCGVCGVCVVCVWCGVWCVCVCVSLSVVDQGEERGQQAPVLQVAGTIRRKPSITLPAVIS